MLHLSWDDEPAEKSIHQNHQHSTNIFWFRTGEIHQTVQTSHKFLSHSVLYEWRFSQSWGYPQIIEVMDDHNIAFMLHWSYWNKRNNHWFFAGSLMTMTISLIVLNSIDTTRVFDVFWRLLHFKKPGPQRRRNRSKSWSRTDVTHRSGGVIMAGWGKSSESIGKYGINITTLGNIWKIIPS